MLIDYWQPLELWNISNFATERRAKSLVHICYNNFFLCFYPLLNGILDLRIRFVKWAFLRRNRTLRLHNSCPKTVREPRKTPKMDLSTFFLVICFSCCCFCGQQQLAIVKTQNDLLLLFRVTFKMIKFLSRAAFTRLSRSVCARLPFINFFGNKHKKLSLFNRNSSVALQLATTILCREWQAIVVTRHRCGVWTAWWSDPPETNENKSHKRSGQFESVVPIYRCQESLVI